MADAASNGVDRLTIDYDVQVAYTVGVEVVVDPREGRVRRVVVADETIKLKPEDGDRQEGTLAPIPKPVADLATKIAESVEWPGWDQGF